MFATSFGLLARTRLLERSGIFRRPDAGGKRRMRLEGKVAVVTGGATGIGAATARLFASEGARVVVTGRRREPLEDVARAIDGHAVPADATDPSHAARVIEGTLERFGGVDVVVANAGTGEGHDTLEITDEAWQRVLDVNLSSPMRIAREALPSMLARGGGSVVLVSSVMGLFASADSVAYATTKAGLLGLARSLAVDFGPRGVRANVLCPGWVVTPMGDEGMNEIADSRGVSREDAYALATAHAPLRRPATAEEIARCALFLASDEASIVTGAVLVADGGQSAVDLGGILFDEEVAP
ncbi:MAG TPA: SDR family NAD(P)-dependent oxidoreductase [Actinomycetota bacterium]|nr:SDR family NAD(P)-dependent oxidoreductase [Actinomycetota bacterium]